MLLAYVPASNDRAQRPASTECATARPGDFRRLRSRRASRRGRFELYAGQHVCVRIAASVPDGGGSVDENAVLVALQTGRIAGAGIDAFAKEPPDQSSPLWRLPNVVVTPHVGGSTREAMTRVAVQAAKNILTILDGETPDPRFAVTGSTQWDDFQAQSATPK